MKRIMLFYFICFLVVQVQGQQQNVAVFVTGEEELGVKKVFGQKMVTDITASGEYTAVERTETLLAELNRESSYQRSGMVSDNDIVAMGKQFGAQLVCVVDISNMFEKKFIAARLISVEKAEIVMSTESEEQYNDLPTLAKVCQNLARKLFKPSGPPQFQYNGKTYMVAPEFENSMPWEQAKSACGSLSSYGYSDWRLPTKEELNMMFVNREEIGGFSRWDYWSSSTTREDIYYRVGVDRNVLHVFKQSFYTGVQESTPYTDSHKNCRCIRVCNP